MQKEYLLNQTDMSFELRQSSTMDGADRDKLIENEDDEDGLMRMCHTMQR